MRVAIQGAFDGLCGVYAVINALEPAGLGGRRSKLQKRLFVELTGALPTSRLRAAMDYGLAASDLLPAARRALRALADTPGGALTIERPFRRRRFECVTDFFSALASLAENHSGGIIVRFRTTSMCHWTVVTDIRPRTLTLRDSRGWRQIKRSKFMDGGYRIYPEDTLFLSFAGQQASAD